MIKEPRAFYDAHKHGCRGYRCLFWLDSQQCWRGSVGLERWTFENSLRKREAEDGTFKSGWGRQNNAPPRMSGHL